MSFLNKNSTFWGYRRENGRVGVRNHVIILPLDDLSNAAAEAVAPAMLMPRFIAGATDPSARTLVLYAQ